MLWSLDNVTLSGRRKPRLDRVSLVIPAGITAVIGRSGVGKTSLLNVLVGFERPASGVVQFLAPMNERRLPLFWVPPQHGLWSHLTVLAHLTSVVDAKGNGGRDAAEELLTRFDLLEHASATPGSLSLGEKSRLNVARALATNAAVLVMDEPLAHVDSSRIGRYWEAIRVHCQQHETSVVLATHSPEVVLREATHAVCLSDGQVKYSGEVSSLYQHAPTRELADLLGPCNWLSEADLTHWISAGSPHEAMRNAESSEGHCVRPEQLQLEADPQSPFVVDRYLFAGASAEVELRDERTGHRLPLQIRPRGVSQIAAGNRVSLRLLMLLLLLVGVSGCFGSVSPTIAVKHESTWSMPPEGARVPAPRGMTVSPDNEYLVLDNVGRVLVFDQNGDLQRHWWMPEYSVGKAEGICVLQDGRIAVADTHYHRVVFFDEAGSVTGMFGQRGSGPGDFVYPVAVAQDPDENLYICEYGQNDRVQKFRPDGTFVLQFGGPGIEPGQFQRPSGIVWYDHRLFVVDAFNNRIQVFTEQGDLVAILGESDKIAEVRYPYDIAVDQRGDLFVVEYGAGRVSKFSRTGQLLGRYGTTGTGQSLAQFSTPWGLAFDRRGRLYVCDTGNRRIVELEL